MGEVRFGQQYADIPLIEWSLSQLKKRNPHLIIASDFVQGDFRGIQVERFRSLTRTGFLNRIEVQHRAANLLLKELEKVAKQKVIYQLSDDDWQVAMSRAIIALAQFRSLRHTGLSGFWPEEIKRLSGADYYRYMKLQWETIQPYMYRIGRSLFNAEEVSRIIGDKHSELLLIIFIKLFEQFEHPIPEKYKKVVDIEALHQNKAGSKRAITPDPIILELPNQNGKTIQIVHNIAFSDVTQYVDSLAIPESIERHLLARGEKRPYLLADFHQERFFGTKLASKVGEKTNDTYIFNFPGCQNTVLGASNRIQTFHSKVLTDKAHRQNTFRKEPVTPGIPYFELFKDGRIRFQVLTNSIREVIEANASKPEITNLVAYLSDIQFGSITMRPEWVIKFLDYSLWTRKSDYLILNGDIIQGFCYPRFPSENRPKRLVSVNSQKSFAREILTPFFPAPDLEIIDMMMGNHEWNIWGSDITGQNNLEFLYFILAERYAMLKQAGRLPKDVDVRIWSRIRLKDTPYPGGSALNHPYAARVLKSGYKLGVQHKWYPRGGGRTPVHTQISWLYNICAAAKSLHVLFGGHKHTFWVAEVDGKLLLQFPGLTNRLTNSLSGSCRSQWAASWNFPTNAESPWSLSRWSFWKTTNASLLSTRRLMRLANWTGQNPALENTNSDWTHLISIDWKKKPTATTLKFNQEQFFKTKGGFLGGLLFSGSNLIFSKK